MCWICLAGCCLVDVLTLVNSVVCFLSFFCFIVLCLLRSFFCCCLLFTLFVFALRAFCFVIWACYAVCGAWFVILWFTLVISAVCLNYLGFVAYCCWLVGCVLLALLDCVCVCFKIYMIG